MEYSWKKSNDEFGYCSLTTKNSSFLQTFSDKEGRIGVKIPEGLMYADGYLFFLEDDDLLSYDEAKEKCSQSEGYQLGIFKTEATFNILHNAFLRLGEGIWVNLNPDERNKNAKWGDGTPFDETEVSQKKLATLDGYKSNRALQIRRQEIQRYES
ncbi:hypothetical protein Avbf_11306 [Armadillidium vulgare]|nr:hypothetical protein Avbf_11306 [Armadillidium vulgare]